MCRKFVVSINPVWISSRGCRLAGTRDRLATCLATTGICCLRVAELRAFRICHLLFDFHCVYDIPGYEGTLAVHAVKRKNDSQRRGHPVVRVNRSASWSTSWTWSTSWVQLRVWIRALGS